MSEFDFDKDVSSAHFASAGWSVDQFNHSNPFDCHLFYIRDYRTGHIQVFTIRTSHLEEMKPEADPLTLGSALGELMLKVYDKTATNKEQEVLGVVLGGYIKGTQTFQQWESVRAHHERFHAFINIYGSRQAASVRPFMARAPEPVLSVDTVLEKTDQVKHMDESNHPEWFRK